MKRLVLASFAVAAVAWYWYEDPFMKRVRYSVAERIDG